MQEKNLVLEWLQKWREGDQEAAEQLYRRYAQQLWQLAENQISRKLRRRVGADDLLQSVFRTFFRRTARGEYSFDHSGSLWQLLVRITMNKARKKARHESTIKAGLDAEVYLDNREFSPEICAHTPTPDEVASLLDEMEVLLVGCEPAETEIFRLSFEGYSSTEIAAKAGCSRWTVRRVLDRLGHKLQRRLEGNTVE
jgi:RNA polymerase sigma-70 factor, ECF subfamily